MRLREQGITVLLSCHDIPQMFRLATRILVLRHGRLIAEVSPAEVHPDDVAALVSGQKVDSSARRQLTRLHRLAGRLTSTDPSSSLSLILSALSAALGSERLCIHLSEDRPAEGPEAPGGTLVCAASFGVPDDLLSAWARLRVGAEGGPVGLAAATRRPVIEDNIRAAPGSWAAFTDDLAPQARVASSWSVPVLGPAGMLGVITVFRAITGKPQRDDLDLTTLYAGYAASAIERDRLLEQVTARNRVLETIREVLQTLAGPVAGGRGPHRRAGRAALTALAPMSWRWSPIRRAMPRRRCGHPGLFRPRRGTVRRQRWRTAESALAAGEDGGPGPGSTARRGRWRCPSTFTAPQGRTVLLACWRGAHPAQPSLASDQHAYRGRGPQPPAGPGAGERERRPPGGDGAAPVPGNAARVPAAAQPRAADAAHRDHRVCLQPAAEGRDLGR